MFWYLPVMEHMSETDAEMSHIAHTVKRPLFGILYFLVFLVMYSRIMKLKSLKILSRVVK